jgi:hypothetical protein
MNNNTRNLSVTILTIAAAIILALLCIPRWWLQASQALFEQWYPAVGKFVYYAVRYGLPLCLIACVLLLGGLNGKYIYRLLSFFFRLIKSSVQFIRFSIIPYCLHSTLSERQFVASMFFRGLAFVFFAAFTSLIYQSELVIENGLIPYKEFAEVTLAHEGMAAYFTYPSVFWVSQSNWFIYLILYAGAAISLISVVTRVRGISFFLLWFFYLSVVNFGRDMFNFPWDLFLMEISFLSAVSAFFISRNYLPRILLFALLFLFFRQWFTMGVVKAVYGGLVWNDLTFMKHYWLNQPSPTPLAVYSFHMPQVVHYLLTASALLIEMVLPVIMLLGRRWRIAAFFLSLAVSVLIELNGNFSYFNVVTVVLGLWCLDDRFFNRLQQKVEPCHSKLLGFLRPVFFVLIIIIIAVNSLYIVLLFNEERNTYPMHIVNYYFSNNSSNGKSLAGKVVFETGKAISRFRIVSPEGVFQKVTRERKQVQVQVKINGKFYPLTFKKWYDVTDFHFVAPFMNYLPYKFYQWSHYVEFSLFLTIHPNTAYLNNWKVNLVKEVFNNNENVARLIGTSKTGKIEQVRIYRYRMKVNDGYPPFNINSTENTVLDSIYINPGDKIDLSVFDNVARHAPFLNKYK